MKRFFFIPLFISSILFSQGNVKPEIFLKGANVTNITGDKFTVWVATNGRGIFRFDKRKNRWKEYSTEKGNLSQDYFFCIEINKKYVWAGSADGLFMLNKKRGRWTKRKFAKGGQLSNWVRSLKYDPEQKTLWIGRFLYLTKLDLKKRRFYDYDLTQNKNVKTNTIKTIALDGDSLVWFGTEAGLHKYDKSMSIENPKSVMFYDNKLNYFEGMGEQVSISDLIVVENHLWIGLDEFITMENPDFNVGGLYEYDRGNEWKRYDIHSGLEANGISSLERVGDKIFVAQYQFSKKNKERYGRGISIIDIQSGEVEHIYDEDLPDSVNDMYFDGKYLWIGSTGGLYVINLSNNFAVWN